MLEIGDDADEQGGHVARDLLRAYVGEDEHGQARHAGDEHRAAHLDETDESGVAGRPFPPPRKRGAASSAISTTDTYKTMVTASRKSSARVSLPVVALTSVVEVMGDS
jgi:hypothetical protein